MSEGQEECQKQDATLPTIRSAEENEFLLNMMEDYGPPWLGMESPNQDNVFQWVNSTPLEGGITSWDESEPNYPGAENCGHLYAS